jgi:peptidoglycan/LPS O-acetylase OafA/YrhL
MSCFDIGRNFSFFIENDERHDQSLKVFDGYRVLFICWVVYGHSCSIAGGVPLFNPQDMVKYGTDIEWAHLFNCRTFVVDVFFFLSGFFLTFIALRQFKNGTFSWMIYIHRLIRLYPALTVTYFFMVYVNPTFGDGPLFKVYGESDSCLKYAFWVFAFLYNFKPKEAWCCSWIWYLGNDWQFFVCTPPILWILSKSAKVGLTIIFMLLLGCIGLTYNIAIEHKIYANIFKQNEDYNDYYYTKPWTRCSAYIVGIIAGYLYVLYKNPEQNKKIKK